METFRFLAAVLLVVSVTGQLKIVHVTDSDFEAAIKAVNAAVTRSGTDFTATTVKIEPNMDEGAACGAILAAAPGLVIDTTRMFRSTSTAASKAVQAALRKLGVPTISTAPFGADLTPEEAVYMLGVPPPSYTMLEFIKKVSEKFSWSNAISNLTVFYDATFDPDVPIRTLLAPLNLKINAAVAETTPDGIKAQVNTIFENDVTNIVLAGTVATINLWLPVISAANMFKKQHKWFLLTKDAKGDIVCPPVQNGTMLFVRPDVVNAVTASDVEAQSLGIDQKVDAAFYFDLTRMTLEGIKARMDDWSPALTYPACEGEMDDDMKAERAKRELKEIMKTSAYEPAYGKFLINGDPNNKQSLKLLLKQTAFNNDSKPDDQDFGSWTVDGGADDAFSNKNFTIANRAKRILRVTTIVQHPFVYEKPDGTFEGYCIDLMDSIRDCDTLEFEYRIFANAQKRFGDMHEVGPDKIEWSGMIGDLVNNSADIALGPLAVMAERETVVDFTVPYYDLVGISILMKRPDIKSSLFKFLTVLETSVWGCILGSYFFTSVLMYLFDRMSPYSFHNNREKLADDPENRDFNLKECLWFCMTSLTPQGGGEAPRNLSGRLVAATWWLFGFIIIASYTANLAAFLTVSRLDSTIESLDDLSRQYKIKYAPVLETEALTYFDRMAHIEERFYEIWKNMSLDDNLNELDRAKLAVWDYPVSDKYTKIWWTMEDNKFPATFEEGVQRTLKSKGPQEGFALLGDSTRIKYATMLHCKLVQVGAEFSRKPLALAVQQGSELKDQLSSAILKLLNERQLEILKERWWTKNKYRAKCNDKDRQSDGISISNIGGVFIVIFIGVVLACITLAIEYCYFRNKRNQAARVIAVKGQHQSKDTMNR